MGEVEAFSILGLRCYFGSNDHYPQHFEVLKRGHWVIRVFFLRTNKKRGLNWEYKHQWRGSLLVEEEQQILEMVLAHKRRLLREWNVKVCCARENAVNRQDRENAVNKHDQDKNSSGASHG